MSVMFTSSAHVAIRKFRAVYHLSQNVPASLSINKGALE